MGAAILVYTLRQTDSEALKNLWPRLNGFYFSVLCGLIVMSHVLRAWRWTLLFSDLSRQPRLWTSFISLMAGYLANLIPPRAGEIIRAALLARFEKLPAERVFGTVLSERAVDVFTLLILFLPAILLSGNELQSYMQNHIVRAVYEKIHGLSVRGLGALGLVLLLAALVALYLGRKKVKGFFLSFWQGFTAVLRLQKPGHFWISTLLIWFFYWGIIVMGYLSLGVWPKDWPAASLALMTAGTIGMIITPGGTIYPILCSGVLALFSVSYEEGLVIGWLLWGSQMIIFLVFGALAFVTLPFVKRADAHHS